VKSPVKLAFLAVFSAVLLALLPTGGISARAWELGLRWLYLLALSFSLSALLTPAAARLGLRFGVMDVPDARKAHARPTPRTGGWAVFLALAAALGRNWQFSSEMLGLFLGTAVIFVVGAIDDARGLSASKRLAAQLAASLIVVGFGLRVTFVPAHFPGEPVLEGFLTVLWLIGITNAVNFLDGVDGLAGALGAIGALFFLSLAWPTRQIHASFYAVSLAGACLGFLLYNWKPASIFLGDSGSTTIGFSLAGLSVMGSWASDNPVAALSTPLLVLAVPVFDMIYTTVSRVKNGQVRTVKEWIEFTGRDHFHHRLMNVGLSQTQTVWFILVVTLCLGLAALMLRGAATTGDAALMLAQAFLIFIIITVLMRLGRQAS
jgi:UDP-GlcNAc:undecaprenyl-phosphate/decaprenyl-phosphate GlcNAc-1-phosphate transferase